MNPSTKIQSSSGENTWLTYFLLITAIFSGTLLALWLVPDLTSGVKANATHAAWFLSRSTGITAYLLNWLGMVFGVLMSTRLARKFPGNLFSYDTHQFLAILSLLFAVIHAFVLLGDAYIGYNWFQVLFPFTTQGDDIFWVGVGQLSLYLLGALVLSFYVRQWISMKAWRAVHYLSFFTYLLFVLHSVFSGTDSQSLAWMYWLTAGSLGVLIALRLALKLDSWLFVDEKRKRPATRASQSKLHTS
ncbi:MAG TPA: hypothetical protein PK299_10195 [Anaerolineales bacterium]|nr:hypothetical protein [Anaerolineales bacterium]